MELNMQEAYFTFEISYFILFLFNKDSQKGYLFLHILYLLRIFLILFLQLTEKVIIFFLQIFDHELLFLLRIDNEVFLALGL